MTSAQRLAPSRVAWWLWLAILFTIPVTSSPIVAGLLGFETPVSPLALVPLVLLTLVGLVPFILRGGKLPVILNPLLAFFILAVVSAAVSFTRPLMPFKGQTVYDRVIRAIITLGIGLCFYLAAAVIPRGKIRLRTSLRALYAGLFPLLIWSSIQAFLVLDGSDRMPLIVTRIHHLFSIRDPIWDRVTGMAYEPSWLGDQLVVLYLPFLAASVINRYSVFSSKARRLSVEMVLLIWSFFILLLTQSRISILSLVAVASGVYFYIGIRMIQKMTRTSRPTQCARISRILGYIVIVGLWAAAVIAIGWTLSRLDDRLTYLLRAYSRLEEFAYFYPNESGFALADRLAFAERIAYWAAGLRTFSRYPLLGVGPGNMGFYFEEHLPAYGYQLTEIRNVLSLTRFGFPNPKNLWIRLLAEGGLLGFGSFLIWYIISALGAYKLWRYREGIFALIGLAGTVGAVTFFFEGFSLDTYALPHSWILFGLIVAAWQSKASPQDDVHSLKSSIS